MTTSLENNFRVFVEILRLFLPLRNAIAYVHNDQSDFTAVISFGRSMNFRLHQCNWPSNLLIDDKQACNSSPKFNAFCQATLKASLCRMIYNLWVRCDG